MCYIFISFRGKNKYRGIKQRKKVFFIPRAPRKKSNTNVYHVIIRGINRQDIFLDKQDFKKFLKEIKRTKELYQYELYAYVLMPNHVHFIIHDINQNLSNIMQSLTVTYSYYFNKKYERIGHLFENRFKSMTIEEEGYLKNVLRYIHKNPDNAGIKGKYPWSSYYEYIEDKNELVNKQFILNLFDGDIINFKSFHDNYSKNQDITKSYEMISKLEDEEAIEIIKELLKEENLVKVQNYEKEKKKKSIKQIIKIEGITKVQIARILGISITTIKRLEKE